LSTSKDGFRPSDQSPCYCYGCHGNRIWYPPRMTSSAPSIASQTSWQQPMPLCVCAVQLLAPPPSLESAIFRTSLLSNGQMKFE